MGGAKRVALDPRPEVRFWDDIELLADDPAANQLYLGRWSLDMAVSRLIIPALNSFIDNPLGSPSEIEPEEWNDILVAMRDGFVAHLKIVNFDFKDGELDTLTEAMDRGLGLFAEWYGALWT